MSLLNIVREIVMRPDTSEWTTTPPGTPGVYWAYYGDEVLLVRVSETNGGTEPLIAVELGDDRERSLSKYTHWLGPLPVPEVPDSEGQCTSMPK